MLRRIYFRLRGLTLKARLEREMEEELRFHIKMREAVNLASGMPPELAGLEARRRFGNLGSLKEYCRDIRGGGLMDTLLGDLRYGFRMLVSCRDSRRRAPVEAGGQADS